MRQGAEAIKLALWPAKGPAGKQGQGPAGKGPAGPQGPQGPAGAQGAAGAAAAAPEYGVASVFVDRGNGPSRFATYSATLGSPPGATTGGGFRFTCTPNQSPCRISYGAAVISDRSGDAVVHPRLLIYKEDGAIVNNGPPDAAIEFCEFADGAAAGFARIPRVARCGTPRTRWTRRSA